MSPDDYGGVIGQLIQFNTGDTNQTHMILSEQDNICEIDPNEFFFSNITLVGGVQPIDVIQPLATVIIDDTMEPECSELFTQTHHSCGLLKTTSIPCTLSFQSLKLAMIPLCILQVRAREWWSSISLSSVILILEQHDHSLSLSPLKMALQVCLK